MRSVILFLVLLAPVALPGQGPGSLGDANRAAGVLVLERLKARDADAFGLVRRCPRRAILLVDGVHDHTDIVLRALGVPFRRCPAHAFPRSSLRGVRLLVIDCPGRIGRAGAARVRRFVARGGTLLTTDWAVRHVLEAAFPGILRYTRRPTRDDVVRISRAGRHPLLRWVFPPGRPAAWWLENQSYPFEVRSRAVRVLLASVEMERRYGSGNVACTFRHGRGRVVHVVSHTYLQRNVCRHPWERRAAAAEASGLDLPVRSPGYRRLEESGLLERVRAGDLNAAVSAQQLLLNVLVAALSDGRPEEDAPGPVPEETAPPVVDGLVYALRSTHLHRSAGGERFLRVSRGLRLGVVSRGAEWVRVRTPAGQTGFVPGDHVGPERR